MIIVLTWKIVETSKASILYMYIDEGEREREYYCPCYYEIVVTQLPFLATKH